MKRVRVIGAIGRSLRSALRTRFLEVWVSDGPDITEADDGGDTREYVRPWSPDQGPDIVGGPGGGGRRPPPVSSEGSETSGVVSGLSSGGSGPPGSSGGGPWSSGPSGGGPGSGSGWTEPPPGYGGHGPYPGEPSGGGSGPGPVCGCQEAASPSSPGPCPPFYGTRVLCGITWVQRCPVVSGQPNCHRNPPPGRPCRPTQGCPETDCFRAYFSCCYADMDNETENIMFSMWSCCCSED